jgi:TRAP-type mannitol/chloroaromatic compound transport system substrate-binding protein
MIRLLHSAKGILGIMVAVGLILAASGFSDVLAAPKYRWKLAMTWGTGFPIFGDAAIKMADMVKKMSDGEMKIRIDSANKHKAAFGILDMVKAGQYEMGHSASYYWKGKTLTPCSSPPCRSA